MKAFLRVIAQWNMLSSWLFASLGASRKTVIMLHLEWVNRDGNFVYSGDKTDGPILHPQFIISVWKNIINSWMRCLVIMISVLWAGSWHETSVQISKYELGAHEHWIYSMSSFFNPRRETLTRNQPCEHPDVGLPASRTVRKFLLFEPVCCILLQQPEQAETRVFF